MDPHPGLWTPDAVNAGERHAAADRGFAARAQQPVRTARIGVLMTLSENDPSAQAQMKAFRDEL
jgi:hypothetical protein